ncbi:ribonuclease Z [Azospirillum sp. sgz302134]
MFSSLCRVAELRRQGRSSREAVGEPAWAPAGCLRRGGDPLNPLLHPQLVNPPFGDPGVLVDVRFERRCLLLDLGDLSPVPPRMLLRTTHAFVSHTHMDHFAGFDHLLRVCLGREKALHLFGPPGFVDRVAGKFAAYSWNLAPGYAADFVVTATAVEEDGTARTAEFHSRRSFAREAERDTRIDGGLLVAEDTLSVRAATLDHGIPSLAYRIEEPAHVNVFRDRLEELGLAVGPWLRDLKRAVFRAESDEVPIAAPGRDGGTVMLPLGQLKARALSVTAGQSIAYVVDAAFTAENAARILDLARGVDLLFIEAPFRAADAEHAAARRHLTTDQAGRLAAAAGVRRVVPFHFSPRYLGDEETMRQEVETAFRAAKPLFFSGSLRPSSCV